MTWIGLAGLNHLVQRPARGADAVIDLMRLVGLGALNQMFPILVRDRTHRHSAAHVVWTS